MKFTADRAAFADALAWVAQVIPKNPQATALAGVRLTLSGDELLIRATDYDTAHTASVQVMPIGGEDGDVLAPGPMLRDLVNALKGQDVSLEAVDHELRISAGRSKYATRLLEVEDFPELTGIDRKSKAAFHVGTVDADDLRGALGAVLHLVDEDTVEAVRGLRLESEGDELVLVGAETSAVAITRIAFGKTGSVELATQVPGGVFTKAARGLAGKVKVNHREGVLELRTAERTVAFRTYVGDFVKWRPIARDESPYVVTVNAAELLDASRRAAITATDETAIRLEFVNGEVEITAGSADVATGREVLDLESEASEQHEQLFSPRLLNAALATFAGQVEVGMVTDRIGPVILRSTGDQAVTQVVMPRRPR